MANFIAGAIKRPGREKRAAKASGRSLHAQLEHDAHVKGNSAAARSKRAAGALGLRFQKGGDLHRTIGHG